MLYFDVLMFASQQYVLKGSYSNLSFQCLLSMAGKKKTNPTTPGIAAVHLHLNFSSSSSARTQPNEAAPLAPKAARVNKTSREADRKRH